MVNIRPCLKVIPQKNKTLSQSDSSEKKVIKQFFTLSLNFSCIVLKNTTKKTVHRACSIKRYDGH